MPTKKLKCIHQGCNRPVIMRCMECSAPVCELHSMHGRFCSDDCHKYGKRKLLKKKKARQRKQRYKNIKKSFAKAVLVFLALALVYFISPYVGSMQENVSLMIDEWNDTRLSDAMCVLNTTDSAEIYPCDLDFGSLTMLQPGSVTFMLVDSGVIFAVGIPPYNMELFENDGFCMSIDSEDNETVFSRAVISGNFTKIKDSTELDLLSREMRKQTCLTDNELHFIIKAADSSDSGIYFLEPNAIKARVNKAVTNGQA